MERTPAASAMDWSIHLDLALRSNNPGKHTKAIQEIGSWLELWNQEPELTMAEYDMFGLVPGEDKLFANAILLRLTDTFMSGDKHTKVCLVKIFLSELRHRQKKRRFNRQNEGILSRCKVENHLELLRRIKTCFNSGDEEIRALALVLFGCWSDFAKDSAEIRYLILSSVVSCHVLEVKASLFAARCFCELSDDFAYVLLEVLVNMVSSSDTSIACRLAGACAFAKIRHPPTLASRAYEKGLKLLTGSEEDDIAITMLISLSIIASRSALLISRQVYLLFTFLSQDKTLPLQATSLRCIHMIFAKGHCHFSPSMDLINAIFTMLTGDFSPTMQFDALHVLYKILMCKIPRSSCSEMQESFTKLLTVVEIVMQSPSISNRLFSMRVLTDLTGKFIRKTNMTYEGDSKTLASQAVSYVMSRITFLCNSLLKHSKTSIKNCTERSELSKIDLPDLEMEREIQGLLKPLFVLLNDCPYLAEFALRKICFFVKCLMDKDDGVCHFIKVGNNQGKFIWSKLVVCAFKVIGLCLKNLKKSGNLSTEIENVARDLVKDVYGCSYFDYYVHTVYSILLHPHLSNHRDLIQNEVFGLESAKNMLAVKDNWAAYRAGKYAVFQGAWFTAAFIFSQLTTAIHSDYSRNWLTSLALFSYSQTKFIAISFPKEMLVLFVWLNSNGTSALSVGQDLVNICKPTTYEMKSHHFIENLDGVCRILRFSEKILGTTLVTPTHHHYFQIRFLALRANVIEVVVDIFKLSGAIIDGNIIVESPGFLQHVASLVNPLSQLSTRLMKLAREYDLVAMSFIEMDPTSSMIISELALSCSVLAFVTGFSLYFQNIGSMQSEGSFHAMVVHDLVARLWHIDREICKQLSLLRKTCDQSERCYTTRSGTRRLENTYEVRSIINTCRYAVMGVVGLQDASRGAVDDHDDVLLRVANDGLELLLDILLKWINIPLRSPTRFFLVRPSVSCQLFTMNRDSKNGDTISVPLGFHLHLDLCLQLSNISPQSQARITKLYCVLICKTSYQDMEDHGTPYLNEKLVNYVYGCAKIDDPSETFVGFKPNGKGQGFSTCVLDVSLFPLGSYEIKWHAGCVDVDGSYWSLPSLNSGPIFMVKKVRGGKMGGLGNGLNGRNG